MKSSAISSAKANNPTESTPRRSFALTGPSRPLDPRTQAVRRDIADVRLAEYVFAPHYAEPVPQRLIRDALLREGRESNAPVLVALSADEMFELLDVTGGVAWGIAPAHGLVGYLPGDAICAPA